MRHWDPKEEPASPAAPAPRGCCRAQQSHHSPEHSQRGNPELPDPAASDPELLHSVLSLEAVTAQRGRGWQGDIQAVERTKPGLGSSPKATAAQGVGTQGSAQKLCRVSHHDLEMSGMGVSGGRVGIFPSRLVFWAFSHLWKCCSVSLES